MDPSVDHVDRRSVRSKGVVATQWGLNVTSVTEPRMGDPNRTVDNRYIYYPGTEALGKNEIRIVACGTGMPAARRGQAAACFLVELGSVPPLLRTLRCRGGLL